MRPILLLLALCVALSVALVLGIQLAAAGTRDAPEVSDAAGDGAFPYCNEYLDIASAWIGEEDEDSFNVHLTLSRWIEPVAEGAGYAVQFTHQGVQWGIIGFYSPAVEGGWAFWTGQATLATVEDTQDAPGSFDAAAAELVIEFPKALFPHGDVNDTTLAGFSAMAADVRPAYPFILGGDTPAGTDANGKWVVCDEASSSATYTLAAGHGAGAHASNDAATNATPGEDRMPSDAASTPSPSPSPEKSIPLGPLALAALLVAVARRP